MAREIIISVPDSRRADHERKIAMFCDFENIALGVRDSEISKFDITLVLERLVEKGRSSSRRPTPTGSATATTSAPSTRPPSS